MCLEDRGNAFGQFKVMVTKPDGSTEAKTLSELGITEINLEGDATEIKLPDGSRITAQTTFTRGNGTTGTVADTVLMAAADGHHAVQTASSDGAGTRTVETKANDAGGTLLTPSPPSPRRMAFPSPTPMTTTAMAMAGPFRRGEIDWSETGAGCGEAHPHGQVTPP